MARRRGKNTELEGRFPFDLHIPSVRRAEKELRRQRLHVEPVDLLELDFTDLVLLGVMKDAERNTPPVGGLYPHTAIRSQPDMGALYGPLAATGDRALKAPHPLAVGWTALTLIGLAGVGLYAGGQHFIKTGCRRLAERGHPLARPPCARRPSE